MPPVTLDQRQKINHELKKLGFGGLEDRTLFAQIATLYRTHEAFRGLLMSTAPDQRRIAYEALRPHLCFIPKPLDVYERDVKERAEREQWDIYDGSAYPKPFKPAKIETEEYKLAQLATEAIEQTKHEAAKGVLEMVCAKCTVVELFPANLRRQAVKAAYEAGWRFAEQRNGKKKAWCPKHVPGRATMRITCEVCEKVELLRVWDEQDGYAAARRLGWSIEDHGSKCPKCSSRIEIVQ